MISFSLEFLRSFLRFQYGSGRHCRLHCLSSDAIANPAWLPPTSRSSQEFHYPASPSFFCGVRTALSLLGRPLSSLFCSSIFLFWGPFHGVPFARSSFFGVKGAPPHFLFFFLPRTSPSFPPVCSIFGSPRINYYRYTLSNIVRISPFCRRSPESPPLLFTAGTVRLPHCFKA